MDEPTAALDPQLTIYVATIIQELVREGYTVIIATHDTLLIEKLPCIIHLMNAGTVIETATTHDLEEFPEKYPGLFHFIQGTNNVS